MKIKNIIWFISYSTNNLNIKILFDLFLIIIINENLKYYLIYGL